MSPRLTLFGPFIATDGESVLPVRGDIPKGVLARLALSAGEVLAADELVGALWHTPPDTVLSSLRAHISRLRGSGWGQVLGGGRRGYSLEVPPDNVDVLHYRALVTAASDDRYAALSMAEQLWRGEPFAGLLDFPFVSTAAAHLLESRRSAATELAELRIERGEHAVVALGLGELLDRHPYDEALHAVHARALARSGRTSDAIDSLDELRARLRRDRGIAPGEGLDELRRAIMRQDPIVTMAAIGAEEPVERVGVPIPLTRFVGRQRELELVARGRTESRLVTLVGTAGVGKTRLAVEVARRANSSVDERQWLIDLAALTDAQHVLGAAADLVAATERSIAGIADRMGGRRSLLIVDNAEHVLGAVAAMVAELLARCEGLTVLVTSREALRLPGERVIPVEPFTGGQSADAVRLFVQRATDSSGVVDWSAEELERVERLCVALDGLPLAVELAAARLDFLSIDEVAESLRGGELGGNGRHASLDAAIAWSLRLLAPRELEALIQLSLFAGPFSLDAVGGICEVAGGDARELTVALARKSLVATVAAELGPRRFRLLDSIREHVRLHHPASSVAEWRARRLSWLVEFAEAQTQLTKTSEAKRARAMLAATAPDLNEALELATAASDRASALRLVSALSWYWYEHRARVDAIDIIERVLALPGRRDPSAEAMALRACSFISAIGPSPSDVGRYTVRMHSTARDAADPGVRMLAASMLSYVRALAGEVEDADGLLAEVEAIGRAAGDTVPDWLAADELLVRGDALRALNRPAQALEVLSQSYRRADGIGHIWAVKGSCYVSGKTLIDVRRPKEAVHVLRTGAMRSMESADPASALAALSVIAAAYVQLERYADAAVVYAGVVYTGRKVGYVLDSLDAAYHELPMRRLRAALDAHVLEEAEARGGAMGLGDLMRFAFERGG